jgi:hypothetical protein
MWKIKVSFANRRISWYQQNIRVSTSGKKCQKRGFIPVEIENHHEICFHPYLLNGDITNCSPLLRYMGKKPERDFESVINSFSCAGYFFSSCRRDTQVDRLATNSPRCVYFSMFCLVRIRSRSVFTPTARTQVSHTLTYIQTHKQNNFFLYRLVPFSKPRPPGALLVLFIFLSRQISKFSTVQSNSSYTFLSVRRRTFSESIIVWGSLISHYYSLYISYSVSAPLNANVPEIMRILQHNVVQTKAINTLRNASFNMDPIQVYILKFRLHEIIHLCTNPGVITD